MRAPDPVTVDLLVATLESAAAQFDRIGQRLTARRLEAIAAAQKPLGSIPVWLQNPNRKTGYLNIYRSGVFHPAGRAGAYDRHGGDLYADPVAAVRAITLPSHYIATVPVRWTDAEEIAPNPGLPAPGQPPFTATDLDPLPELRI